MKSKALLVYVGEQQLFCPFCRHELFHRREIKLNTTGMSLLGWDWLNKAADGLVCDRCGRIEMFLNDNIRYAEPG